MDVHIEKTLVLLKPDAVKRGIVGEILHRFERAGLKMAGMKLLHPTKEFAKNHYPTSDEYFKVLGNRTLADCEKWNLNPVENMGSDDALEIGKMVWGFLLEYITSGPVLAIVLEGPHAIENVRTMIGHTIPLQAQPGTIRGDFALESAVIANFKKRSIYNLIHASGNREEAQKEIALWFKKEELLSYKLLHEDLYQY